MSFGKEQLTRLMDDSLNILLACFSDVRFGGGGVTRALTLARGLMARGYSTRILCKDDSGSENEIRDIQGLPVQRVPFDAGRLWRLVALAAERHLKSVFSRMDRPDLLIAVSPYHVTAARAVWPELPIIYAFPCLLWRCLVVGGLVEKGFWPRINLLLTKRLEHKACKAADRIIVQSRSVVQDVTAFCPEAEPRLRIIPTPAPDRSRPTCSRQEIRQELGCDEDTLVFLAVGHLDSNKNFGHIIEEFARCGDQRAWLWICGSGPERPNLETRILQHGMEGRVHLLGARKDMPSVYSAADVFVHAAWYDNYPNVYLEAMSAGLPLIGPIGEFPRIISPLTDIIEEGTEGLTYDLTQTGHLAAQMQKLCLDRQLCRTMGNSARRRARQCHALESYIDSVEEVVIELAGLDRSAGSQLEGKI